MIVFLFNRYEGARNAEALAEYVNKEGGTLLGDSLAKLAQTYFCFMRNLFRHGLWGRLSWWNVQSFVPDDFF